MMELKFSWIFVPHPVAKQSGKLLGLTLLYPPDETSDAEHRQYEAEGAYGIEMLANADFWVCLHNLNELKDGR